ncbi:lytic murein transglycosylase [Parvularcula lutaonensis]|uniref:Lytic murein transglycosylase n=1 Tax=Parvularcula lutaonensis TaxID=491923 RepID=A0ABV7MG19_9PROT|nr:lytic murein transglycosylase [Parvularcula lutaonensis]GGY54217.1 murein transglycosylase [Parvularcula lutaonensis]
MIIAPLAALALAVATLNPEFEAFRRDFRDDAIAAGIHPEIYDIEMATVEPLPVVLKRDANQPEFVRPIWEYLDSAVSDRRVADGRKAYLESRDTLEMISNSYGVDPGVIAAIWGLESNYGRILGTNDILSALSTLGYQGRRQTFGRRELIAALKILQEGYATRDQLKGSWAGAMGQTQFIPTTYLAYAVDQNNDGRRDLWGDLEDVFASTANYLDEAGWRTGEPWGIEVTLPNDFDYAAADGTKVAVVDWIRAGVKGARVALPDAVDLDTPAKLLLPAGARGPAFLTFKNFDVIKRYNNATSYALGVSLLSERIKGSEEGLVADWPRDDRPLSRSEREALQARLAELGYNPGGIDGVIGPNTRRALRSWQKAQGLPADGYPSAAMLALLLEA